MKQSIFLIIIVAFFLLTKKKAKKALAHEMENKFTPDDAKAALLKISGKYGKEMASNVERIMRLETAHFKSGQYQKTGTAGMVVGKWSNLPSKNMPTVKFDVKGKTFEYIVWPNVYSFMEYLVSYINRNNGNWARWNSTSPVVQEKYRALVNGVTNKFIV